MPAVSVAPDLPLAAATPVESTEVAEPVERVELEPAAPALPPEPTPVASSPAELPPAEVAPPLAEPLLAEAVVEPPPAEVQEPERAPEPVWASEPTAAVVDEELSRVAELSSTDPSSPAPSPASYNEELPPEAVGFDVLALTPEERELHRRANRVAKVSMQDVKMLRPVDVALGREHKDICNRLRDDIEKAHKEYDRRFRAIMDQPVDYFYDWMVEILGGGDPQALGEYPYPSPVLRR